MFLLPFALLRQNILPLLAESAETNAKRVRKQWGTAGKQAIHLLENKSTDDTAHVFVLESERRTFLRWMRARIYRIKSWLNLSINKRSIICLLCTNIRIFMFITWNDFVLHSEYETKHKTRLSVSVFTSIPAFLLMCNGDPVSYCLLCIYIYVYYI